jgi:hypothetical protein
MQNQVYRQPGLGLYHVLDVLALAAPDVKIGKVGVTGLLSSWKSSIGSWNFRPQNHFDNAYE